MYCTRLKEKKTTAENESVGKIQVEMTCEANGTNYATKTEE